MHGSFHVVYGNPVIQQTGAHMTSLEGYVEQAKLFVQQTFPGAMLEESRQVWFFGHISMARHEYGQEIVDLSFLVFEAFRIATILHITYW